jgi:hypothetical protein
LKESQHGYHRQRSPGIIGLPGSPETQGPDGKKQEGIESTAGDESWCGRYAGFGPVVDIFQKKNGLYAKFKGPAALLVPEGDGVFKPVL